MAKSKAGSVKIPMSLLKKIICLLVCCEPSYEDCDDPMFIEDYSDILLALKNMEQSIELHDASARIINDCSYDIRWQSRMDYANNKHYEANLPF